MNNEHLLEFCDKLFKLQNEYGLYISSTTISELNGSHIANISYDNWDGDELGFYIVRYIDDGEVCRCKYTKQKH